jgi:methionyl aminopeptidase
LLVVGVDVVDVTTYHRGFHGDLNETMFVGKVDEKAKLLVQVTHECLAKAIAAGIVVCC